LKENINQILKVQKFQIKTICLIIRVVRMSIFILILILVFIVLLWFSFMFMLWWLVLLLFLLKYGSCIGWK